MTAFDELSLENEHIMRVLHIIDHTAEHLETGRTVPVQIINDEISFVKNFAEKCHNGKEEKVLFPALNSKLDASHKKAMNSLINDHIYSYKYIKNVMDNLNKATEGDRRSADIIAKNLRDYSTLLKNHIKKEDSFFKDIKPILEKEENIIINNKCEKINNKLSEDENYLEMLDRLEASEILRK